MAKVSVIVPVYNVGKHLNQCLNSIVNQTLREIEIICVDDCSLDSSREILQSYASGDPRIQVIFHDRNLGTSQTRKDGVLRSRGKYVMFVDGDDALESNACQRAYEAMETHGTDVLQFGTEVVNCAGMPPERIRSNQRALTPSLERIEGKHLIFGCWKEKKFNYTLWNKIYRGDLCRKAFACVEDGYYPKAQDLYAFFVIAYYAGSYMGIGDVLYHYHFGLGVTGGNLVPLEKYDLLLTEKEIYDALERFLEDKEDRGEFGEILSGIREHFLNECVSRWKDHLNPDSRSEGFRHLTEVWGLEDVLCSLAAKNWYHRAEVAEKIGETDYFAYRKRSGNRPRVLAAYYRSIRNGGAQRVAASLCNLWADQKGEDGKPLYRVILITDEPESPEDYSLDPRVKRERLPHFEEAVGEKYRERYREWNRILEENGVDIVVSGMWVASSALWDMLTVKGHPSRPAFLIHAHNFCCVPYLWRGSNGVDLTKIYRICDGAVCLSRVDQRYTSCFARRAAYIVNPVTFDPGGARPSAYEKNSLLWVGRISWEKRPKDAVYMMKYVAEEIPEAKLYLVGSGEERLYRELQELILALHLEENVVLAGFQSQVEEYYEKASVFVSTAEFEGFPLTFGEAMSHGVPIVSYEMPWLTYMEDGRGILPVEMGRYDLLARQAVSLLKNPRKCEQTGNEGKQQVEELLEADIGGEWERFFAGLDEEGTPPRTLGTEDILLNYLVKYQHIGKMKLKSSLEKEREKNRKEIERLEKRIRVLENSTTFRAGKLLLFLPVSIKKLMKRAFRLK